MCRVVNNQEILHTQVYMRNDGLAMAFGESIYNILFLLWKENCCFGELK
jgi:hypothetical protein